jgi:hypothetical protein
VTDNDEPRSESGHATPEGHTPEKPAASEIGEPGTPGAGMTPDAPHAADAEALDGEAPAHRALSDDDHGHAEPRLGPIDWGAWAYALLGAAAALAVVALFWVAIN